MLSVPVALGARSYPIHIGAGLLADGTLLRPHIAGRQVMVITNETVAPLYLERLLHALEGYTVLTHILPDGEEYKTLDMLNAVFDALLAVPCERSVTLIALGGGVVGDLAGFAAACYQRGVAYIQVPTTLLAQVDSSVGGKTAVNHRRGKNMIGAFHQPRCVLADTGTLDSLPQRELVAGLAEVIKYGLVRDREFFDWLECHIDALLARDAAHLAHAIERCCRNKAAVVAADEREAGVRAILNLGHTFGHAIEVGLGYGEWLHGEAVAAGMALAADLSCRRGRLSQPDAARVEALLGRAGLPVRWPAQLGVEELLAHMAVDKKAVDGHVRLVLLASIGAAEIVADCPAALLRASLAALHGVRR